MFVYFYVDADGRVTGSDATKFFAMSSLSRPELKQVYFLFCGSHICLLFM